VADVSCGVLQAVRHLDLHCRNFCALASSAAGLADFCNSALVIFSLRLEFFGTPAFQHPAAAAKLYAWSACGSWFSTRILLLRRLSLAPRVEDLLCTVHNRTHFSFFSDLPSKRSSILFFSIRHQRFLKHFRQASEVGVALLFWSSVFTLLLSQAFRSLVLSSHISKHVSFLQLLQQQSQVEAVPP